MVSKVNVFACLTKSRKAKKLKRAMVKKTEQNDLGNLVKQKQ